ncbi:unnamed protein product [Brugia pahangi]|uniref:Transthyretin-like family protein n=1 Tax=Brugia pahangi TaxID=6280 RepID=A0A0N4TYZ4_BRUPA|nr:unnamed protein product [Brugia pahangi]
MTKLLVYIAFIIYCGRQANQAGGGGNAAGMFIMKYRSKYVLCAKFLLKQHLTVEIPSIPMPLSQKFCNVNEYSLVSILDGEIITDYKVDKLWDDGSLIQTTQVEECISGRNKFP